MKNVLHWKPPEGLGVEVVYTVQYYIYGKHNWLNKSECKSISRTYCDLSSETYDHEHQYYARVMTSWKRNCSQWAETRRFNPKMNTLIGPPMVAVSSGDKSISITLTAPEKWKKNPGDISIPMNQIYSSLKYDVSICNRNSNKWWSIQVTNHTLTLSWLESDTTYCVTVQSCISVPYQISEPSEEQCVTTLKDQASELTTKIMFWYVLPVIITAFIISVMGYHMYRYIRVGKQKHPPNLILIYGNGYDERLFLPAEKILVNFITMNIVDDSRISQKEINHMDNAKDLNDPTPAESQEDKDALAEDLEVKHLGYASQAVEILSDREENENWLSPVQPASLCPSRQRDVEIVEYELDVRAEDICPPQKDQELSLQEDVSTQGNRQTESQETLVNQSQPELDGQLKARTPKPGAQEPLKSEEAPEDEESTIVVDWDPQTGRLCIPSLSDFKPHAEECESDEGDGPAKEGLLSKLYEKRASNRSAEGNEAYLTQFMEEWGLHVQMEE
ncbi:interleukin-20 receptor subunit alpha [Tachyglossus aculeatus]|uniref:interleukin-20 receptor subunit alpha n=1 Tax=Tachyglossus aculeatus TaxID=9261 RepID=UPI0018F77A92|nr:interleukin-20 receptor subunit alpha [Tachyglossus aculeatus]